MTGYLVYSMAGHDKGRVYAVISENDTYVWLADGDIRTMENLKKKNRKHVQLINKKIESQAVTNETIKWAIKLYCKDMQEVK